MESFLMHFEHLYLEFMFWDDSHGVQEHPKFSLSN